MILKVFTFKGSNVREITDEQGNPWFIAKDVCEVLGLEPKDSVRYLDGDEKSNVSSKHIGQSGGRDPLIINESGLYSLILRSRKPEAKSFKKWVTAEVLPSIRKTGSYSIANNLDREILIQKALIFQDQKIRELETEHKELSARANVADRIANAKGLILPADAGKIICGHPNLFIQWLEDEGILFRRKEGGKLIPKVVFQNRGYFDVITRVIDGEARNQTYFTPKGLVWIGRIYYQANNLLDFPIQEKSILQVTQP